MNAPQSMLAVLLGEWREAKAAEDAAVAHRRDVERLIVEAMPPDGPEASSRAEIDGYRIRVTNKVTRSVDSDALSSVWPSLTAAQQQCFRWKADVVLAKLRPLQELMPADYAAIARCIEAKPAKASVSIEEVS